MSDAHPEGCAPVDHHTAMVFEVPASLLLSPTLEADSGSYVTLLLIRLCMKTLRVHPQVEATKVF